MTQAATITTPEQTLAPESTTAPVQVQGAPVGRGDSAQYLTDLYAGLGSQRNDFRNYNLNRLIAALVEGETVIDIGCGSGALITVLHRLGKDASGLEPNQNLIDAALARDPGLHLYRADGSVVDTLGRTFETITIIDVLEHIEDDGAQVDRMRRALKPGGQLIVLVPAFQFLFGKRDVSAGHYRRYSKRQLVGLLRDRGFEIESARFWNAIGFVPYLFAERVLRLQLKGDIRTERAKGPVKRMMVGVLHAWYRKVENNINFRFGLSLIVTARSPVGDPADPPPPGSGLGAKTPDADGPEIHVRPASPAAPALAR